MAQSLEEIQDALLDRIHAGEQIDREALLAAHPEHATDLAAFLGLLDIVEGEDESTLPPTSLGEYRILRELGRGGMGIVYEAEQTSLQRHVALKVLPPSLRMDTRLVTRFQREAQAAGRLRHPGIVPVYAVGEEGGAPFFAMEFVPGRTLREVIRLRKEGETADLSTDPETYRTWAVETCVQVADALAYAHGEGIVHRDVKPGNILLGEDGTPRLTDFGLARDLRSPGLSLTGEVLGSPQYMSPEQAIRHDHPVDERTDIYSLAVTLYQLLTLQLPYAATTHAELLTALAAGRIVPPRQSDPGISKPLEQVLLRALQEDPRDRYGSAADFAADLRAALAGQAPARAPRELRRLAIGFAALALVLGGLFLGLRALLPIRSQDETTPPATTPPPTSTVARDGEPEPATRATPPRAPMPDADPGATPDTNPEREPDAEPVEDPAPAPPGRVRFTHELPEAITQRDRPYLRAVEWASEKEWFTPEEAVEYALAEEAWRLTERHLERLVHDPEFNRGDRASASLRTDPALKDLVLHVRWQSPYLLCHASRGPVSPFDALQIPHKAARRRLLATLPAREEQVDALLQRQARQLGQLHEEYLRRYEKPLDLRPLLSPWGGRPDLAQGRSYRDGVPLVIVLFEDNELYDARVGDPPTIQLARYGFEPRSGSVYVSAEEATRPGALDLLLGAGVRQLEFWFARQRNTWRKPYPSQDFFRVGFPLFLGVAAEAPTGTLEFHGRNPFALGDMQTQSKELEERGGRYELFPLEKLVGFQSFTEAGAWAAQAWGLSAQSAMVMYQSQAWALIYFLHNAEEGAYRAKLDVFHNLVLHGEVGGSEGSAAFREAFRIRDGEDWRALERPFHAYVRGTLMKMALPAAGK